MLQGIEIIVQPEQIFSYACSQAPAALVHFYTLDSMELQERRKVGEGLHKFIAENFGLDTSRFFIFFHVLGQTDFTFEGQVYADYLKSQKK